MFFILNVKYNESRYQISAVEWNVQCFPLECSGVDVKSSIKCHFPQLNISIWRLPCCSKVTFQSAWCCFWVTKKTSSRPHFTAALTTPCTISSFPCADRRGCGTFKHDQRRYFYIPVLSCFVLSGYHWFVQFRLRLTCTRKASNVDRPVCFEQ